MINTFNSEKVNQNTRNQKSPVNALQTTGFVVDDVLIGFVVDDVLIG